MGKSKSGKAKKAGEGLMRHQQSSILIVALVIVLLLGAIGYSTVSLKKRENSYNEQKAEIERQIEEEKERSESIDELEKNMKEKEYVEDVARERLGLVYPDEIVFKAQ